MFLCGSGICGIAIDGEATLVVVETWPHPEIDCSTTVDRDIKTGNPCPTARQKRGLMNHRRARGVVRDFDMPKYPTLFYHETAAKSTRPALSG
jgi:hypothetical protein